MLLSTMRRSSEGLCTEVWLNMLNELQEEE